MGCKIFYLAHSVILQKEGSKFQERMEKCYNIKIINPFTKNQWEVEQMKKLNKLPRRLRARGLMKWTELECEQIVKEDLKLIRQSDGIIAMFDEPTIGTCQEIFVASYVYDMPVYIITKKYGTHAWLRALIKWCDGKIFETTEDFEVWLRENGYANDKECD
jgi:nucleoside 2-deoxyribosyltransferase